MVRKIIKLILLRRAKVQMLKNATFQGINHRITPFSRVSLTDGAKKTQVILKDGCWPQGQICVQSGGIVIMHEHSKIDTSTTIQCVNRVEIGAYSSVAINTIICDNNNHPINPEYRKKMRLSDYNSEMRLWKHSANAPIIIGKNCWIGSNVRIGKGITIGDNSIVAACSVVTKDVPANCIVAGNPAKVVKTDIDQMHYPTSSPEFNEYIKMKDKE